MQGRGLSTERTETVIRLFREDATIKEIAGQLSCSVHTVGETLAKLRKAGVDLPYRNTRANAKPRGELVKIREQTEHRKQAVTRLYREGLSISDIAFELSCPTNTVASTIARLRREGVDLPLRHKKPTRNQDVPASKRMESGATLRRRAAENAAQRETSAKTAAAIVPIVRQPQVAPKRILYEAPATPYPPEARCSFILQMRGEGSGEFLQCDQPRETRRSSYCAEHAGRCHEKRRGQLAPEDVPAELQHVPVRTARSADSWS